jgi:pimeloyl-ACP methyl ester carboxylesterase
MPIVLLGHSCGGAVITNAAVGDPEVKALVFVDAFIPDLNETLGGLLGSVPGSCLAGNPADIFDLVPCDGGPTGDVDTYIKPSLVPCCSASGLPASQAAVIGAIQRPLAASTLSEPTLRDSPAAPELSQLEPTCAGYGERADHMARSSARGELHVQAGSSESDAVVTAIGGTALPREVVRSRCVCVAFRALVRDLLPRLS